MKPNGQSWQPPKVQPGDQILTGIVTDRDGAETTLRVLYRPNDDGPGHVTGYDQPLNIPAGGSFMVDLPSASDDD